jgi:hypothetical protein
MHHNLPYFTMYSQADEPGHEPEEITIKIML